LPSEQLASSSHYIICCLLCLLFIVPCISSTETEIFVHPALIFVLPIFVSQSLARAHWRLSINIWQMNKIEVIRNVLTVQVIDHVVKSWGNRKDKKKYSLIS
jgi:hypothetical protein